MDATAASHLSMDDGTLGCNANHKQVWRWLAETDSEWSVVLEDDALPAGFGQFRTHLAKALTAAPTPLVSLYRGHNVNNPAYETAGMNASRAADHAGAHWITSDLLLHAVAVAIRTDLIPDMLTHLGMLPPQFAIDEAISHWARAAGIKAAYTWPSLVDHADTYTLFRHPDKLPRPKGRVAYEVGTRSHWDSEAVTL